jgi:hypothetical protein
VQPSPNLCLAVCYIDAMMRKLGAMMALLLAAALAPSLRAGQADDQPAPTHRVTPAPAPAASSSTAPAATNAEPPASTPSAAGSSPTECEGGPCPPPSHITIATPAPAPAPWSLQDRIKWATVVLLVLVAYVGIWFAVSTLQKIERQTRYAEATAQAAAESAKAALEFAQAQARNERPWILVSAEPAPGAPDAFTVVASNRGRGPARIVALAEGIAIAKDELSLPGDPAYNDPDSNAALTSMILLPGESIGIKSFRRDDVVTVCKSPDQLRRVENWEEKIYLYGRLTYLDLQSSDEKQIFETAWCCWYIHGRQRSGLVMAGKPPYNQHS